jgi:transposase
MRNKVKFVIGEVVIPGMEATIKDIHIELEGECSIGEIKGVVEIIKNLPLDLFDTYKNFCKADREATEMDTEEEAWRKSKGLTYSPQSKSIIGEAFSAIKNLGKSTTMNIEELEKLDKKSMSKDLKTDETLEKTK